MKQIHESIPMSAIRAFFVALFGVLGAAVAIIAISLLCYAAFSTADEKSFSSDVKLLPDADGNRSKLASSTPILLQIPISGEIGKDKMTGKHIEELLLDSREDAFGDDRVKGILLVVNSPGGGVTDSDIIYRHLKEYKARYDLPIYAFVDGLCASGGYYITCASDKIYASDVSLIGSVGVLAWPPFFNITDTLKKVGLETLTVSAGKGKDEMNPFRPWKEGEQDHYQKLIDYYYGQFVTLVSESRGLDRDQLEETLGAKVYPAPEALSYGLVDETGATRAEVLTALAKAAGIDEEYQVVGFETSSWWQKLSEKEPGKIKHEFSLPNQGDIPFLFK